jgi:hypothetical protein
VYTWETWKLRALLIGGLLLVLGDHVSGQSLHLGIPRGIDAYLLVSSFYFALDPQGRVEKWRQELLLFLLFPGAFVTALVPLFALFVIVGRHMPV